jgi:hypothetical protein
MTNRKDNTMVKAKYKGMREEEFNKVRTLLKAGLTQSQIVTVTGRSNPTISRIARSKTYKDYKGLIREHHAINPTPQDNPTDSNQIPKGGRRVAMDESEFKRIKDVLGEDGMTITKAAQLVGRSASFVSHINNHNTLYDYFDMVDRHLHRPIGTGRANYELGLRKKELEAASTTPTDSVEATDTAEAPRKVRVTTDSDRLDRIATALERLADAWEATPKKTGIFR